MCLQYILVGFTPSIILPLFPSPLLRTISTGFILLVLYMNIKYIHHIHPQSPFPYSHPFPQVLTPRKKLFYPFALHFWRCILMVQVGFTLVLQACVYHALIKLPSVTYSFSITMLLYYSATYRQYTILYSYIDRLFQYFSFSNIFLPSITSVVPSDRLTNTILLSLSLYICMCIYMCACAHICNYIHI
jgi:hypothetical protein